MKTTILLIIISLNTIIASGQENDSLFVSSFIKENVSTIKIQRTKQCQNLLGNVKIIVDGQKIGKLANGKTKSFNILSGNHKIVAKINWYKSQELNITVKAESTKTFLINFNKSFFISIYAPNKYLILTELQ